MASYGVAEAKNKFAHLLERAEAGESITITRHGKAIAELKATTPVAPRPSLEERRAALDELAAWRATQPLMPISAAELIRKMRDEEI